MKSLKYAGEDKTHHNGQFAVDTEHTGTFAESKNSDTNLSVLCEQVVGVNVESRKVSDRVELKGDLHRSLQVGIILPAHPLITCRVMWMLLFFNQLKHSIV